MYYEDLDNNSVKLTKWIPRISLIIGICAFLFQILVLYPWHLQLSKEFTALSSLIKNTTS